MVVDSSTFIAVRLYVPAAPAAAPGIEDLPVTAEISRFISSAVVVGEKIPQVEDGNGGAQTGRIPHRNGDWAVYERLRENRTISRVLARNRLPVSAIVCRP